MADRWRDDDRFERGGFAGERQGQSGPRGDYGDDRDFAGQNYGPGREERSAYSGWGRPDDAREFDDYTRSSSRRRGDRHGSYSQGGNHGQGSNADRYRGSWQDNDQRYGASAGGGYESGGYGVDDGGRMGGYGGQRSSGNWAGYGSGGEQGRFDQPRDYRGGGYGEDRRGGSWRGDGEDRGWMDRAGDEVRSWFGDEEAERRRQQDQQYRGMGPKGYTRSDERIREDVCDRLSDDWRIDASDIEVQVKDGEVTLSGTVRDRLLKRRAEDVAEEISGVRNVQNNLRVRHSQQSQATSTALGGNSATNAPGTSSSTATRAALGTDTASKV